MSKKTLKYPLNGVICGSEKEHFIHVPKNTKNHNETAQILGLANYFFIRYPTFQYFALWNKKESVAK